MPTQPSLSRRRRQGRHHQRRGCAAGQSGLILAPTSHLASRRSGSTRLLLALGADFLAQRGRCGAHGGTGHSSTQIFEELQSPATRAARFTFGPQPPVLPLRAGLHPAFDTLPAQLLALHGIRLSPPRPLDHAPEEQPVSATVRGMRRGEATGQLLKVADAQGRAREEVQGLR